MITTLFINLALILLIFLILIVLFFLIQGIYLIIPYFKLKDALNSIIITNNNEVTRFYYLLQNDDLINYIYDKDYFNSYIENLNKINHKYIQLPLFIYSTHLYLLTPNWKLLNKQSIKFKKSVKKYIKVEKISLKEFNYIYKNIIKLRKLNKKIIFIEEILTFDKNNFSEKRKFNKLINERDLIEKNLNSFFEKIRILKEVI